VSDGRLGVKTRRRSGLPGQRRGRRRRGALGHARSEAGRRRRRRLQTRAVGAARGKASGPGLSGRRASDTETALSGVPRVPGRRRLYGVAHARGSAAVAHALGGDGVLTSGSGAERERLTGGTPRQIISELKTIPNENSSNEMARN
jgi:hypothetical protein